MMNIIVHHSLPYYPQHPRAAINSLSRKVDTREKAVHFKDVLQEKMKANWDKRRR